LQVEAVSPETGGRGVEDTSGQIQGSGMVDSDGAGASLEWVVGVGGREVRNSTEARRDREAAIEGT
jgi:hypothetical protein